MDLHSSQRRHLKVNHALNGEISAVVVVPIINEANIIPQALTGLSWLPKNQIIFVDGGSSDGSAALLSERGYKCVQSEAGRAVQMNYGANISKSDIVVFLHIDTSFNSSNFLNIKKAYKQGYLSGRFNVKLSNNDIRYRIISFFINIRSRLTKISTGDQIIFVRRDVFNLIGGYEQIPLMEDVALSRQLRRLGCVACLKDTVITSSRRWQARGIVSTVILMWKLRLLYWLGVDVNKLSKMYRGNHRCE